MAIKKLEDYHNALKNGKAIHRLSLFSAEEMESCIRKENRRQITRSESGTADRDSGTPSASGPL
jgi:hypothetical protein